MVDTSGKRPPFLVENLLFCHTKFCHKTFGNKFATKLLRKYSHKKSCHQKINEILMLIFLYEFVTDQSDNIFWYQKSTTPKFVTEFSINFLINFLPNYHRNLGDKLVCR